MSTRLTSANLIKPGDLFISYWFGPPKIRERKFVTCISNVYVPKEELNWLTYLDDGRIKHTSVVSDMKASVLVP